MNITFSMPDDSSATIAAQGRIAWKNAGAVRRKPILPVGFGVEFVTIDEQAVEAIQRYVEKAKTP